ncbi:tyrosine-protein phosphatase [Leptolyngbya sp. 15MV]|nr:tyrosine-protein phosphatase [Leptolyngbya sp. 15MV]
MPTSPAFPRVLAVVALIAVGAVLAASAKPDLFPKNFGVVEAGKVYRSGQLTPAAFRRVVERHGIRTIIDMGSGKDHPEVERLNAAVARSLGVRRYVAALEGDARGNPNWYVWALRLASDPENQPVLIHCGAGSERTGCIVALYDNVHRGVPLDQGYIETKRFGHRPTRNPHLRDVMEKYGPSIVEAYRAGQWLPFAEVPPPEGVGIDARPVALPPSR